MTEGQMTGLDPIGDPAAANQVDQVLLAHSAAEERFEHWRRTIGLFAGPALSVGLLLLPLQNLSTPERRLASVVALVVTWWMTEPIPIPATALLGAALAVIFGVATAQEVFAPFASPTIFLFMGSFIMGRAVSEHGLDRRLAASLLSLNIVQGSIARMSVALIGLTIAASAWMSNTATTAMMMPVALGVLSASGVSRGAHGRAAGTPFCLAIAYAASIGGIITPVGTPPNLITLGLLDRLVGVDIPFLSWMVVATPIALVLGAALAWLTAHRLASVPTTRPYASSRAQSSELARPWTAGQRNSAIAFGVAVVLWITPGAVALLGSTDSQAYKVLSRHADEAVVAIFAASLLFLLPTNWAERKFTLGWESAARIDWGTILLFGGGLSLGQLMFSTGLAARIGSALVAMSGADSLWGITAASTVIAVIMTEVASNTAATNMLVPVVISIAQAAGVSPAPPAIGACLGASMAFMLPISTPPNAIVYGTGLVPITAMIRYGLILDVVAIVVILAGLRVLCPIVGLV